MKSHPLSNYYTLIENNNFQTIEFDFLNYDEFYNTLDPNLFENNYLELDLVSKTYYLKSIEDRTVTNSFSLIRHFQEITNQYAIDFKNDVREELLDRSDKLIVDYTKLLQKEISSLKFLLDVKQFSTKEVVYLSLKKLDIFLSKYSFGSFINWKKSSDNETLKLRWIGKVSELATLFADLQAGTSNLRIKLVDNSRQELKKFILDNFVDENNLPFNHETVYRYLDDSKTDIKKSKNRIDIRKMEEE